MYCGKCDASGKCDESGKSVATFRYSAQAIAHLSSHSHLIEEIKLLKAESPELETIFEPFQLVLLGVLFVEFHENQGGYCWACKGIFRDDLSLSKHFEDHEHNRNLVKTIVRLVSSPEDETQVYLNPQRSCVLCRKNCIRERDLLDHVNDVGHQKIELEALKFHFKKSLSSSACIEFFKHRPSGPPGDEDLLMDIGDSVSVINGRNNDDHPNKFSRYDAGDNNLFGSSRRHEEPPGSFNENASERSRSTTDMTGRCFNEDPAESMAGDSTAASSSCSSTNLSGLSSYASAASDISHSSASKKSNNYIKKGFDQQTNQVVYVCEACKKKMTGEAPLRQHLKAENHKKMVNVIESGLDDHGNNFICEVCSISVSGIDNWNQHLQGKSHKKKEKEFPLINPVRPANLSPDRSSNATFVNPPRVASDPSRVQRQNSSSPLIPQQVVVNTQSTPNGFLRQQSQTPAAPASCVIKISIGRCLYCSEVFETAEDLKNHVNTPTHVSNQRKIQAETVNRFAANWTGDSIIKCAACGNDFQGWDSLNIHLKSEGHLSKVFNGPNGDVECILCHVVLRNTDYLSHLNSGVHLARGENIIREVGSKVSQQQPSSVQSVSSFTSSDDDQSLKDLDEDSKYMLNRMTHGVDRMKVNEPPEGAEPSEGSGEPGERVLGEVNYNYCNVCKTSLSSAVVAKAHYAGKKHLRKAMQTESVDDSSSSYGGGSTVSSGNSMVTVSNAIQIVKSCLMIPELSEESLQEYYETNKMVSTIPRFYQHDLYRRIMADDSAFFCYLPTGMGKTLIACLVLSKMLEVNPDKRFAYFVTDKILLAIQQMEYIRKEFAGGVSGYLKIGAICGTEMMLEEGLKDPRKHNILVVTAEYLKNRLEEGSLKWQEACCVVFDEVHHCDLKHPYSNLIKLFHSRALKTPVFPKLIGLTASPAIKESGRSTFNMLLDRLRQFGEAKLVTASQKDIEKHRVIPKVDFHLKSPLPECLEFASKVGKIVDTFLQENQPFLKALPQRLGQLLTIRDKNDEMNRYYNITIECEKFLEENIHNSVRKGVEAIRMLLEVIFLAKIVNLYEASLCLEFQVPEDSEGIKTQQTRLMINSVLREYKDHSEVNLALQSDATPYSALLEEIEATFPDKESATMNIFILILVRTRCDALALTKIMQREAKLEKLKLEVDCVVGHGGNASGSGVKGMKVKKQLQTLHNIPSKHILVATSVAEEGIDIPGCEKVIMFEAPKDTTAFVQIKGRARKQESTVILIGSEQERTKMDNLIASEKFMLEAVQQFDNQIIKAVDSTRNASLGGLK